MVIMPTVLILNNGQELQSIELDLAHLNELCIGFIDWLEERNYFCNSLVDRIVPGTPAPAAKQQIEKTLGYRDNLLIAAESYALLVASSRVLILRVLT
jgi:tagaturonate reductase